MSIFITSRISSVSQQLRAAERVVQDFVFHVKYIWNDEIRHVG